MNETAATATQAHPTEGDRGSPAGALHPGPEVRVANEPVQGDSPPTPAEFSPQQQRLLAALAAAPDMQSAVKLAGVGRTTVHRWMQQPAFRDELNRRRDAVFAEALASVKTHAGRAVTELTRLLRVKDNRLRRLVCNDILEHGLNIREFEDIERRLTVLEKAVEASAKRRHS